MRPLKLLGLQLPSKTCNENDQSNRDCGNLWQRFEKEHIAVRIPGKLSDNVYAVYFDYDGDHTKPFSYFIGCNVRQDIDPPTFLNSLIIPEQKYVKVTAKGKMPDCISESWKEIWDSSINRAYQYDFEVYDDRSLDWENAEVDIFISVRE